MKKKSNNKSIIPTFFGEEIGSDNVPSRTSDTFLWLIALVVVTAIAVAWAYHQEVTVINPLVNSIK